MEVSAFCQASTAFYYGRCLWNNLERILGEVRMPWLREIPQFKAEISAHLARNVDTVLSNLASIFVKYLAL